MLFFYSAIGAESPPIEFQFNTIDLVTQNRIKTDLYPVLRNKDKFDLKTAQLQVKAWLESLLKLEENEQEFLHAFRIDILPSLKKGDSYCVQANA